MEIVTEREKKENNFQSNKCHYIVREPPLDIKLLIFPLVVKELDPNMQ